MKQSVNGNGKVNHFRGDYVQTLIDVGTAAAVSGHHVMVIGLPGGGKTTIGKDVLNRITGGAYLFKRINPTTPVEEIIGNYDPVALLNEGRAVRVIEETPYNPSVKGFILDEAARGNDAMFDALLDVLDRQDVATIYDQAFCVATSNFTIDGERADALKDRFAMWVYLPHEDIDIRSFVSNYTPSQRPTLAQPLPTWDEIEAARAMKPGPRAIEAVTILIESLAEAAAAQEIYRINQRRLVQWADILYRVSFLITGDPDFDEVPKAAAALLKYCWPCQSEDEAGAWQQVVNEIVDLVGTSIDAVMAEAVTRFKQLANASDIERPELLRPFGEFLTTCQEQLRKIGGNSPRVDTACNTLKQWFKMACNGVDPTAK